MTIYYAKWRITDRINDRKMLAYGYAVHEKIGEQYKHPTYFPKLSQAVHELFERAVRSEHKSEKIDLTSSSAMDLLLKYARRLDDIKNEILEACYASDK